MAPPTFKGKPGELRDRMNLQGGSDAQQKVGPGAQFLGALDRRHGEHLTEEDDLRLERPVRSHDSAALCHSPGSADRAPPTNPTRAPQPGHTHDSIDP